MKTASGATAVQIVHKRGRTVLGIDHVGSAHDQAQLAILLETARARLHAGQQMLPLEEDDTAGRGRPAGEPVVEETASLIVWEALEAVYSCLGFDQIPDHAFKALVAVALGRVVTNFLAQAYGVRLLSHVVALGPVAVPGGVLPGPEDLARVDADPVRCAEPSTSEAMVAAVEACQSDGDTLGGVVEVVVWGLPAGLGSHVHWDRRLDARLAAALMGIQAIKGVEVGDGFDLARFRGSVAHDEIVPGPDGIARASHRSGGIEGGMSTGEVLRVRAAMKPIATVPRALRTVDTGTGEAAVAHHQRSDVCAVPAAGVVAEAMVALVLADAALEKFGGDSVGETRRNYEGYVKQVAERGLRVASGAPA